MVESPTKLKQLRNGTSSVAGQDTLVLYNTMSRSKQEFRSREKGIVKIFTCGPSIYRRPHIGNYRSFMYEDILVKYLEYLGYEVRRTINFTDVEDKTISEATDQKTTIQKITREVEGHFFGEAELLQLKLPDEIPRASTSIESAVHLINTLIDKGYAYWHEGNVFFDPLKKKDFGKLFRLDMSRWPDHKVRFKRDTYNGNRWNLGDFILWHGAANAVGAVWDTPLGRGRPSWNIQDPAMIVQTLGEQIDINCGGIDNIYRHHDYNIALMEAYSGKPFANYFLHGAHLIVDGRAMSKSRGNILYPADVLSGGFKPYHLRFFLYYTHFKKKLNYTAEGFRKTSDYLDGIRALVSRLIKPAGGDKSSSVHADIEKLVADVEPVFRARVNDNLSVGAAVDGVVQLLESIDRGAGGSPLPEKSAKDLEASLRRIDTVLGTIFA